MITCGAKLVAKINMVDINQASDSQLVACCTDANNIMYFLSVQKSKTVFVLNFIEYTKITQGFQFLIASLCYMCTLHSDTSFYEQSGKVVRWVAYSPGLRYQKGGGQKIRRDGWCKTCKRQGNNTSIYLQHVTRYLLLEYCIVINALMICRGSCAITLEYCPTE